MKYLFCLTLIIILALAPLSNSFVVKAKTGTTNEYQNGYKHGLAGELIPENGPVHHTPAFEQGFIDGYCSTQVKGTHSGSDADWGTFDCDYDATQFKGSNESAPYDVGFLA